MFLPLMPSVKPVWRLFAATWPAWPPISTPVAPFGKAFRIAVAAVSPPRMSSTLTEQVEPSRALSAAGTMLRQTTMPPAMAAFVAGT